MKTLLVITLLFTFGCSSDFDFFGRKTHVSEDVNITSQYGYILLHKIDDRVDSLLSSGVITNDRRTIYKIRIQRLTALLDNAYASNVLDRVITVNDSIHNFYNDINRQ